MSNETTTMILFCTLAREDGSLAGSCETSQQRFSCAKWPGERVIIINGGVGNISREQPGSFHDPANAWLLH